MKEAGTLYMILNIISIFSAFIPALVSVFFFKRLKAESYTLALVILFWSMAIGDFIGSFVVAFILRKFNMPWFHIASLLELFFFSWAYYKTIPFLSKVLPVVMVLALLYKLIDSFYLEPFFSKPPHFDGYFRTMSGILLTILPLLYFYQIFSQKTLVALEKQVMFWISSGVLLYYAGSFLTVSFYNILLSQKATDEPWNFHSVINTLANVLYGIAMSCSPRSKTT